MKRGIAEALISLRLDGVGRDNLYKAFLPDRIGAMIAAYRLDCTEEELTREWLRVKDLLP